MLFMEKDVNLRTARTFSGNLKWEIGFLDCLALRICVSYRNYKKPTEKNKPTHISVLQLLLQSFSIHFCRASLAAASHNHLFSWRNFSLHFAPRSGSQGFQSLGIGSRIYAGSSGSMSKIFAAPRWFVFSKLIRPAAVSTSTFSSK